MELHLKKNAAAEIMFPMVDSTTPANLKSGLTVTDTAYYKDGGSWTALPITDTVTEIASTGMYTIEMTDTELNHDLIMIKLTGTGAADSVVIIRTFARNIEDLAYPATSGRSLDVDTSGRVVLQAVTHTGATIPTVTTLTGHTAQTGDSYARIGAAGVGLTDLGGMSTGMKAEVNAECDTAISDAEPVEANVIQIDGQATSGNNATLYLKQLNISNSTGDAITAQSTGGNGKAVNLTGNGTGNAIRAEGGASASAAYLVGGATAGYGLYVAAIATDYGGFYALANSGDAHGMYTQGAGSGHGIYGRGGGTGNGIRATGGNTSGSGMYCNALAGNSNGMTFGKNGTGKDIDADEIDNILTDTSEIQGKLPTGTISDFDESLDNVNLANDTITSAKFDESTAFPIASADSGSTQIARVGADSDTLETLSDQIDAVQADLPTKITKNAALNNFEFLMVDSTDHITPKTGLTVTAERSIDGGSFGSCSNSVSEVSNGIYKINLSTSDMNGDVITLKFTATGADDRLITIVTQST